MTERELGRLVTGSTAGIGFAIASLLAEEGASVVENDPSPQQTDAAICS